MTSHLRVLLADDEPLALERLVFACRDIPDTTIVATASNGLEAAALIAEFQPDVAILDIQMPGRTGLGVAVDLPAEGRPEIIFVTAYDEHALDAFAVEAADYILKPLRLDRVRSALERVRRRRRSIQPPERNDATSKSEDEGQPGFWVQERHGSVRVAVSDIQWIEAAKDYVLLNTPQRSYILRATMRSIEEVGRGSDLIRVHRSAFVRAGAVRSLQYSPSGSGLLILSDDVAVQVGQTYLREVERKFGLL